MPRPATVTELLAIVKEQSRVIAMLTEQLARKTVTHGENLSRIAGIGTETGEVNTVYVNLPERVQEMVRNRAFGDPAMYEYLETLAASMLSEGMDELLVVQMIAQGEQ